MASKIGVYFDVQNIGGGLDVEALAEQVRSKWSDLTPVVKVLPMLSVAEDEVRADIEANGLDGVLFCGASPATKLPLAAARAGGTREPARTVRARLQEPRRLRRQRRGSPPC